MARSTQRNKCICTRYRAKEGLCESATFNATCNFKPRGPWILVGESLQVVRQWRTLSYNCREQRSVVASNSRELAGWQRVQDYTLLRIRDAQVSTLETAHRRPAGCWGQVRLLLGVGRRAGEEARALCGVYSERRGQLRQTPTPGSAMLQAQNPSPASSSTPQPCDDKAP